MGENDQEAEIIAIRQVVADAQTHQNDPGRFIPLHTADTSVVNFGGRRVLGRDALHQAMAKALTTPLAKVITTTAIEDIRFIRPDVAIVAGIKHVSDEREGGAPLPSSSGWLTYVVVKEPDAWRIVSAQTTPIRE
jgi:uncharacterized protein (TIGR02246 family)